MLGVDSDCCLDSSSKSQAELLASRQTGTPNICFRCLTRIRCHEARLADSGRFLLGSDSLTAEPQGFSRGATFLSGTHERVNIGLEACSTVRLSCFRPETHLQHLLFKCQQSLTRNFFEDTNKLVKPTDALESRSSLVFELSASRRAE